MPCTLLHCSIGAQLQLVYATSTQLLALHTRSARYGSVFQARIKRSCHCEGRTFSLVNHGQAVSALHGLICQTALFLQRCPVFQQSQAIGRLHKHGNP